jgi:hypothetical protein
LTNFWTIAGLVAGLVVAGATLLAALFTVWLRRIDSLRPEWFGTGNSWWHARRTAGGRPEDEAPQASGRLINVGAGTAFRLQVVGAGCHVLPVGSGMGMRQELFPIVDPGETVNLYVTCAPEAWDQADIVVLYRERSPWRRPLRRRIDRVALREFAPRPRYEQTGVTTSTPLPEPEPRELPDSRKPQHPLPTTRWWQRRQQTRSLRRTA